MMETRDGAGKELEGEHRAVESRAVGARSHRCKCGELLCGFCKSALSLCLSLPTDNIKEVASAILNAKLRSLCQDVNQHMENHQESLVHGNHFSGIKQDALECGRVPLCCESISLQTVHKSCTPWQQFTNWYRAGIF